MSLIGLGEYGNALAEADQLQKRYPYLYMAHYLKGLTQYQQHLLTQAQESVLHALKLAPGHLASHLLAGTINYQLGQLNLAEHHLREYLRQRLRLYLRSGVDDKQIIKLPGDEQITKLLAATLMKLRKPGEVIELLEPGKLAAADDVQYLSLLGSAYLGHGNAAMGLEYLERAIALAPDSVNIRKQLAIGHLALGEEELAMGELQTAVDLNQGLPQSDVLQVMIHLRNKDFDSALTVAETLTNKMPDSPVPDNLKGAAQLGKKDYQAARDAYEAALKIQPDFLPAHINLAQLDLLANDSAAAKGHYQKVLSYDEGNLKALLALAVLTNQEGRADETEQWLKQAYSHHPETTQPALLLVAHYQRQGKTLEALDLAGTLATTHHRDPQVLKTLAFTQVQAGEDEAAITTLRSLVQVASRSPDAYYKLAMVLLNTEKYIEARKRLQQALTLQPDYPAAQLALGRLDIAGKNLDAAQDIARDLKQAHPDAYFGYELEGDILFSRQDFRQAAAAYAIASSKASSAPLARKLFQSRFKAGEPESADEALRQWLTGHPEDVLLRRMLATSLQIQGKNPQAIEEYLRVLKQDSDNIIALNNIAWLYQDAGNPEGLKYAERAHELAPRRPDITDTLGWLLVQNGDINRGLVLLQEAALMAPNIPDIRYHMVVALDMAGRRDEAREELDRLLTSNKTFPDRDKAEALRARLAN
jgi:putative PEP-CTERM system TPR-repeat lipoprotein